jgi:hypothetical protein
VFFYFKSAHKNSSYLLSPSNPSYF